MRVSAALLAFSILVPFTASGAASRDGHFTIGSDEAEGRHTNITPPVRNCPRTTSYLADKTGVYRDLPLKPKKLTELPPAAAYMAVFRHIGGCEAPLTMVDYRNPRKR